MASTQLHISLDPIGSDEILKSLASYQGNYAKHIQDLLAYGIIQVGPGNNTPDETLHIHARLDDQLGGIDRSIPACSRVITAVEKSVFKNSEGRLRIGQSEIPHTKALIAKTSHQAYYLLFPSNAQHFQTPNGDISLTEIEGLCCDDSTYITPNPWSHNISNFSGSQIMKWGRPHLEEKNPNILAAEHAATEKKSQEWRSGVVDTPSEGVRIHSI